MVRTYLMANFLVFSFTIDGSVGPSVCKPYKPRDEYWSPGDERIGYYDSEERAEFYLEHGSSMPSTYNCVFQFEEMMDQQLVAVKRKTYDLLVAKYKIIRELYGDVCIVGRTALTRLRSYNGTSEDLPAFVSEVLQSLLWSMMDLRAMLEVWNAMRTTNERAPIDDFNSLHRRMDQLEVMTMSCPHEAESSIPRRYRKYFEMQNTTLSALIHPVYTTYLVDFGHIREIYETLRNSLNSFEGAQGQLETHVAGMEARLARFPIFSGAVNLL